jgi:hypothetical protein
METLGSPSAKNTQGTSLQPACDFELQYDQVTTALPIIQGKYSSIVEIFLISVVLFHENYDTIALRKFLPSVAFETDASVVGTSETPSSQSVVSESTDHSEPSPFAETAPSSIKYIIDARKRNWKKQQVQQVTSEENIRDISEKRILKIEREYTAEF